MGEVVLCSEKNSAWACGRHVVRLAYTSRHVAWQVLSWWCWFYDKGKPAWKPGEFPQPCCILSSFKIKKKKITSSFPGPVVWPSAFPFFYSNLFSSLSVSVLRFSQDWRHVGDYGKNATSFFFFLSCLALLFCAALQPPFPLFGSLCMDSMRVFMRLHAESWSRRLTAEACYHSAHPPPPWYFCPSPPPKTPISVLACLLLQHLVHNHPTSHFFPPSRSGRNTGQGWEGCPVPTLGGSHTPREKHARASKHTLKHMRSVSFHCWICIRAWVVH